MPKIHCLERHVANLIAAGEVVERPASVVKELTENAIDAGATAVAVEIQRGGMGYIRVTDNGCGMEPEDAETAFLRHATSKIQNAFDLEAIGTLGFRGEALAAIAAVARVELMTRTADREFGTGLTLEGGKVVEREVVGCPEGTTMIVRNLFYNTPARLKFMKRDVAEGAAVYAVVQHVALSHPEVSFRFVREGKEELLTPGDGDLRSAVYAVLGREVALGMLPCKRKDEELSVEGFISRPTCCRGNRSGQHFFVNGRYVKSRTMSAALEQAYQNQKMVGKFPGCVLRVACKLNAVDVNVHPAKTEVKFTSERKLFDAVYYAVKETLEAEQGHPQAELKPKVPPKQDQVTPNQTFFRTMTAEEYRRTGQVLHSKRQSPAPPREDPFETAMRQRRQEVRPSELVRIPEAAEPIVVSAVEDRALVEQPVDNCVEKSVETVENPLYNPGVSQVEPVQTRKPEPIRLGQTPAPAPAEQPEETPDTAAWRLAGELFDTYVIVEQGDTAYLIDKHAAHERMNFDRMRAADWKPMSQLLLTPQVLHLAPEECGVLLEQMGLLEQFGFAVESFGGDEVLVREAPNDLSTDQIEPALEEIASKLLLTGTADPAAVRDEVLHTMACKAAIKGGWKNDRAELEVVARAVMSGQVKYCPHGRPVAIELSRQQLEKQFKRS
ncbi:MAG: DNA mismatch repair endonuclease MutL [Eubacteriales bacterium]|nr:DNA mismatch repair endonuclease MutL [Eubacteriales bacterium]